MKLRPIMAMIFAAIACAPLAAHGQTRGQFEALVSSFSFTNTGPSPAPASASIITAAYRGSTAQDLFDLRVSNRRDSGTAESQNAQYFGAFDRHRWSHRFFTDVNVGGGTSAPYPSSHIFGEGAVALDTDAHWRVGLGAGSTTYANGIVWRYWSVGPSYISHTFSASLRFLPSTVSGAGNFSSTALSMTAGRWGAGYTTLTLRSGIEPEGGQAQQFVPSVAGARVNVIDVDERRWLSKSLGVHLGADFGHAVDTTTGSALFDRHGFTAGLFASFGE